jgi:hypothetical protein
MYLTAVIAATAASITAGSSPFRLPIPPPRRHGKRRRLAVVHGRPAVSLRTAPESLRDWQHRRSVELGRRRSDPPTWARSDFQANTADFFTPSNWWDLDAQDLDLRGAGPIFIDVRARRRRSSCLFSEKRCRLSDRSQQPRRNRNRRWHSAGRTTLSKCSRRADHQSSAAYPIPLRPVAMLCYTPPSPQVWDGRETRAISLC